MNDWSRSVTGIESVIEGANRLTEIFGYWPTFHDAEVVDLHLWRGDVNPERDSWVGPVLTVKLHHWELSDDDSPQGVILRQHTLSTLRFHDLLDEAAFFTCLRVEVVDATPCSEDGIALR